MNYVQLLCFIILFPFVSVSQTDTKQISFRELTVEQGLSQNSVVSIAQDSIGYMWFATQDGLNKYDGKAFTFYNKQFEDVTRPTFSKLGKTYIDRLGDLWIISNSGHLEKFNKETNTFQSIKSVRNASCVYQSTNQDYFIGTYDSGLFKIDGKTKDTLQIFKNIFRELSIYDLMESDSSIYVATSEHFFQIKNDHIINAEVEDVANNFSVSVTSPNKTIWLGTFGKGLYFKTKEREGFVKYKHLQLPLNLNIQDLLVDKNENLWIATYGDGAYLLDIEKGTIQHFVANKNDPYALHYDDVLCLYEDFTGMVWLGTDGAGLSYYDKHLKKFNAITTEQTPKEVHVDVVRAIEVDDSGTMWLGTSGKGLTSVNTDSKSYKTYTAQNSRLLSDRIMSLLFSDGELWIGHQGKGLQIRDTLGQFRSFLELEHQTIWKIYKAKNNQLWLCTRDGGLMLFDKSKGILKAFTTENSALTSNNIRTIEAGNNGQLWIGARKQWPVCNGYFVKQDKKIDSIPDKIKSLYLDTGYALDRNQWKWIKGISHFRPYSKNLYHCRWTAQ
ncbi:MAG: two-component regulator propeller domain-containing protein [Gelidibacter sp.]